MMDFRNPARKGKTESRSASTIAFCTRACLISTVKALKYARLAVRRNAATRVCNGDDVLQIAGLKGNRDIASCRRVSDRVVEQVPQHLPKQTLVPAKWSLSKKQ